MTIDKLIEELNRHRALHGGQVDVLVAWEGTAQAIEDDEIYFNPDSRLGKPVLWIEPLGQNLAFGIDPHRK